MSDSINSPREVSREIPPNKGSLSESVFSQLKDEMLKLCPPEMKSKNPAAESSLPKLTLHEDAPQKDQIKGGVNTNEMKQIQDMTNNQQTTAQKAAEKADAYIRS